MVELHKQRSFCFGCILVEFTGGSDAKVAEMYATIVAPGLADFVHHFAARELDVLVISTIQTQHESG